MSRLFQFFELPMPDSARLSDFYPANYHSFDSNKTLGNLKQIRRPLFPGYLYAVDLKGIWNDDAVRLMIANGGLAKASLESGHPGHGDLLSRVRRVLRSH